MSLSVKQGHLPLRDYAYLLIPAENRCRLNCRAVFHPRPGKENGSETRCRASHIVPR